MLAAHHVHQVDAVTAQVRIDGPAVPVDQLGEAGASPTCVASL